jgi:hypothetical protein
MGDRKRKPTEHGHLSRRIFLQGTILVGLGCAPFPTACDSMVHKGKDSETVKGGMTMEVARTNVVPNATIPPIDARVPARTETATFALG